MALDLANIISQGNNLIAKGNEAQGSILGILTDAVNTMNSVAQNTVSTGQHQVDGRTVYATPLQTATDNAAALEAQKRTQDFAHQIGINPDQAADLQFKLAEQLRQSSEEAIVQGQKVKEMSQVGLFDDPFQFVANYVMLPDERNKLNAQLSVVETNKQQLAAINQAVQQTAVTSNTIATKITQANLDDQYKAATAALDNVKAKLRVDTDLAAAQAIKEIFAFDKDRFHTQMQQWQAARQAEALDMQKEAHDLAKKQHDVALMRFQREEDALKYDLETINLAETKMYGKPVTSMSDLLLNKDKNNAVGKRIADMRDVGAGLRAGVPVTTSDSILGRVQFNQNNPLPPGTSPEVLQILKIQEAAVAKAMETNKGAKPEVINAEAQKLFDQSFTEMTRKVDPKDQTNPFKLPSLSTYDQSQALKTNPAYVQFRKQVTNDEPADVGKFMQTLVPNIAAGKVKLDDVVMAVQAMDATARKSNEVLNQLYLLTGKKIDQIGVPVEYYTGSQQVAKAAAVYGTMLTGAAATTGIGTLPAIGLGAVTAGSALYGARPSTHVINPADPVQVKAAIISMLPLQLNTGVGADALKPVLQRQGVNQ